MSISYRKKRTFHFFFFLQNCGYNEEQQQQLSHLSQVFGGRLHEPKENYLHPCFLRSPCALLTCPKLICSTRRTGESVGLHRTWPNHRRRFYLIFSSIEATPILIRISPFLILSLRVLPHIQQSIRISVTLIFWAWYLFITQHSVPYNKAGIIAVR